MGQVIEKILQKYGIPAILIHGGESIELRIFFQPSMSKSWQSMDPIVGPLGQLPGGQYLYIGPAGQELSQGDEVNVGGKGYILRRVELYLDHEGPAYWWGLGVRKGGEDTWGSQQ